MLKDIFEKIKDRFDYYEEYIVTEESLRYYQETERLLSDLKKEAELQEEMIKVGKEMHELLLKKREEYITCYYCKSQGYDEDCNNCIVNEFESIFKKWEEIIKE